MNVEHNRKATVACAVGKKVHPRRSCLCDIFLKGLLHLFRKIDAIVADESHSVTFCLYYDQRILQQFHFLFSMLQFRFPFSVLVW